MKPQTLWMVGGVLAFLGLLDALYLSYAHMMQDPLACSILEGCDAVAKSPYSKILGVPIAYLGVIYYVGMLKMIFWNRFVPSFSRLGRQGFVLGGFGGGIISLVFLYIQVVFIQALCIYCVFSAIITWLLALCAFTLIHKTQENSVL